MDISFVDSATVGVEDYLQMVGGKTSALFGAASVIGAMFASTQEDEVPAPPGIPEGKKFKHVRFNDAQYHLGIWPEHGHGLPDT